MELKTITEAINLLDEVMWWHCDPDSPDYNGCDTEPCSWCAKAASTLAHMERVKRTKERMASKFP